MREHNGEKYYSTREVAKLKLISSPSANTEESNYFYILKLIKRGAIEAKNSATGSTPYYIISESEINRYNTELYG